MDERECEWCGNTVLKGQYKCPYCGGPKSSGYQVKMRERLVDVTAHGDSFRKYVSAGWEIDD